MFVRWSETASTGRLGARLVEGRRIDGRVKQEHVGILATLRPRTPGQPTALETRAFWQEAMATLERYQNRLTDEQRNAIVAALHARVPMPSVDGVENAVTDTLHREAAFMRHRIANSEGIVRAREEVVRAALRKLRADREVLRQERAMLAEIEDKLAQRIKPPA